MKLEELFYQIPVIEKINWDPSRKVNKITSDSRTVEAGDAFIACPGARMDGHDFIGQSAYAGASVIVYDRKIDFSFPKSVAAVRVVDARKCFGQLLKRYYRSPDEKIKLIGVTGTNGKTTTAYLLYRLLKEKVPSAYIGTLWYEYGDKKFPAPNTTPGTEVLLPMLNQMAQSGIKYCFMEISSHALHQSRVFGLQFEVAVFTQLTQDHLDYHKTMERYYQSKRLLFVQDPPPRKILINRDCPYGRRLLEENLQAKSFGESLPADYATEAVECTLQGSKFKMIYNHKKIPFTLRLPLKHNVINSVAALGVLHMLGFDPEGFQVPLQEIPGIPGRMERVNLEEPFEIFVDYAHTPDACEHVLSEARRLGPKRVLTLMGCGGDRDQEKRPLMAAVAAQYSDILILTSDNPRSEDPENILRDMKKGISSQDEGRLQLFEILDRRLAIEKLLQIAEPGDVLLVLGKGHEDYQILGDIKIPFDDRLVIKDCLKRKSRVFTS